MKITSTQLFQIHSPYISTLSLPAECCLSQGVMFSAPCTWMKCLDLKLWERLLNWTYFHLFSRCQSLKIASAFFPVYLVYIILAVSSIPFVRFWLCHKIVSGQWNFPQRLDLKFFSYLLKPLFHKMDANLQELTFVVVLLVILP